MMMRRQVLRVITLCILVSLATSIKLKGDEGVEEGGDYDGRTIGGHGGYGGGGYGGGGYDYDYGGGYGGGFGGHHHKGKGYDTKGIVVHKPVLVKKPVVVHQPAVEYKKVYYKPPPPPPPPPVWVHKPVIHKVKEWRLVEVPKVGYQKVLVYPTPYYEEKKKGPFQKFFDSLREYE
ncbi:UNVERIFIED_CONTAM: hypothetical protein RMT77_010952 [Armadillidium vulgare]